MSGYDRWLESPAVDGPEPVECEECGGTGAQGKVVVLSGKVPGRCWEVISAHPADHPDARNAAIHAAVTGSVGCIYNGVEVARAKDCTACDGEGYVAPNTIEEEPDKGLMRGEG